MSGSDNGGTNRREYPRVRGPVFWKPARMLSATAHLVDVGMGGVRVYSDDPPKVGSRMDLELFLADGEEVELLVQVVWVNPLPEGSPAAYDVGLRFLDVPPDTLGRVMSVLESGDSA